MVNRAVKELLTSLRTTLVLAVILCGLYPVAVWIISQAAFPHQANGSLVAEGPRIAGSSLIAQNFNGEQYFHPRPSAAGKGYDGASSGGSNAGPMSAGLVEEVEARMRAYRERNGLPPSARVPVDAVTCSASGLDPHISPANARMQAERVARARGLDVAAVRAMIGRHTEGRDLWILGEERVNVLLLNLALDRGS